MAVEFGLEAFEGFGALFFLGLGDGGALFGAFLLVVVCFEDVVAVEGAEHLEGLAFGAYLGELAGEFFFFDGVFGGVDVRAQEGQSAAVGAEVFGEGAPDVVFLGAVDGAGFGAGVVAVAGVAVDELFGLGV